jgi:hypothetical protein
VDAQQSCLAALTPERTDRLIPFRRFTEPTETLSPAHKHISLPDLTVDPVLPAGCSHMQSTSWYALLPLGDLSETRAFVARQHRAWSSPDSGEVGPEKLPIALSCQLGGSQTELVRRAAPFPLSRCPRVWLTKVPSICLLVLTQPQHPADPMWQRLERPSRNAPMIDLEA